MPVFSFYLNNEMGRTSQFLYFFLQFPLLVIKHIIQQYPVYVIFFIVTLVCLLLQYQTGNFKPVMFHDSPYPVEPSYPLALMYKFGSVWRDLANFGYFDPSGPFLSIFYFFWAPFFFITNNLVIAQFLFLLAVFNFTLISTYQLARYLGINKSFSILAGILYLANPYSIFYVWRILNSSLLLYAVLPLIFLCLLKIAKDEKFKKNVIILLFGEFLIVPAFANPAEYISYIFFTLVVILSQSFITLSQNFVISRRTLIKCLIVLTILFFPISGYLMSILKSEPLYSGGFGLKQLSTTGQIPFYVQNIAHLNLPSLFSLTGLPPLYEAVKWFNYEYIYTSDISKVASLLVAAVIVGFFVVNGINRKIDKRIYPFLTLLVVILILLSGLLTALLHIFPILSVTFRDPYQKLGSAFTLVLIILFCYSAYEISKKKIIKKYRPLEILLCLIIVFQVVYWSFPFISGNFIPTGVKADILHTFSAFNDAPNKYRLAIFYLNRDMDVVSGRVGVLVYPLVGVTWCEKDLLWGNDLLRFSGISTVSTTSHVAFTNETDFLNNLSSNIFLQNPHYAETLAKLGIKYILIQKKPCVVDAGYNDRNALVQIDNALENNSEYVQGKISQMYIKKVIENEYYSLFKIPYKPSSISLIETKNFDPSIIKRINFLNNTNNFLQRSVQPQYEKLSSTEYLVKFVNITKPFYLTLAQSYDDGWKAAINGKEQISDKNHFIVSGFANGWYVNKTGYFDLKLYYQTQNYYDFGLATGLLMVIACLSYLILIDRAWVGKALKLVRGKNKGSRITNK